MQTEQDWGQKVKVGSGTRADYQRQQQRVEKQELAQKQQVVGPKGPVREAQKATMPTASQEEGTAEG